MVFWVFWSRSRGVRGESGSASSSGLRAGSKLEGRDAVSNNGGRRAKMADFGCTGRGRFPSAASFFEEDKRGEGEKREGDQDQMVGQVDSQLPLCAYELVAERG